MAFVQNFTAGQNPLSPGIVVLTDTSTGTDAAITQRRVFVQDANGNYLVPAGTSTNYTQWDIANAAISLNILTQNTAASITVQWLDVTNAVLYTLTEEFCFDDYGKQFLYYLVQLQGITPTIPADANYDQNTAILWSLIRGAENAVTVNNDIKASQNALDRATQMELQQSKFF